MQTVLRTRHQSFEQGWKHRNLGFAVLAVSLCLPALSAHAETGFTTGSSDPIIEFIDQQIRQGWVDNEVTPSPIADDAEWLRRVYLDIAGHIPAPADVDAFLKDEDPAKRSKLIEKLLASGDYVRNFTEVWTNHLIGRNTPIEPAVPGCRSSCANPSHGTVPGTKWCSTC